MAVLKVSSKDDRKVAMMVYLRVSSMAGVKDDLMAGWWGRRSRLPPH